MYLLFGILLSNCNLTSSYRSNTDIITEVDPFIGTADGGGACFVGACLPFGLVRLGPDTSLPQNTSGYVAYKPIDGFGHLQVSGTGGPGKYGNIMVIPQRGQPVIRNYSSNKSREHAELGYYLVYLVYVEQMKFARSTRSIDNYSQEVDRLIANAIEKATVGKMGSQRALDQAAA